MGRQRKRWRHVEGERPHTVIAEERPDRRDGPLRLRWWDPDAREGQGNWRTKSLKHRDFDLAKIEAKEKNLALLKGDSQRLGSGGVTIGQIFDAYKRYHTPQKVPTERRADRRRIELWEHFLGRETEPHEITLRDWESFLTLRASGAIDARGNRVPDKKDRRPVRARTIHADAKFLRIVLNWATEWRTKDRRYLLRENPIRGFRLPEVKNVRRPVASTDRYEKLREVSDRIRWSGQRTERSYLSEILDLACGTGRRLSAILRLRYEDIRLDQGPYGSIRWPADTDKQGRETLVPISPFVRKALDRALRARPGIGTAPIFPSAEDSQRPVSRYLADRWLRQAEKLAELEPQEGSLWHAFRRAWATSRKHLPDADVAEAGGWKDTDTLRKIYQQPDQATMLHVVMEGAELREAR